MNIRALGPADVPSYVALRRQALADSPWAFHSTAADDLGVDAPRLASKLAEPRNAIIGGFDDAGRLVASCGVAAKGQLKMAHRAFIWGVYVTPAARGRGLGKAVVRAALDLARSWPGVNSAGLSVSVRSKTAQAMYRSLGFVAWGLEPRCVALDGTFLDEVHMIVRFDRPEPEPIENVGASWNIRRVHSLDDALARSLAEVLMSCVDGGASVGFMRPLPFEQALAFWRRVGEGVERSERAMLVAEDAQGVCGTVQLVLDVPPNQPHRADLVKMLVHPRARRQGLGAALMKTAESMARDCGKTLLVLDAVTDGDAARLYERLGWVRVGDIPNYALMPDGAPCGTTYFYRDLSERAESR